MVVQRGVAALAAALATRRRRVSPTAIGLTPPSFLIKGRRVAPKKQGRTATGTPPARTRFAKAAKQSQSEPPWELVKSFKCCGFRPSLRPADPGAKLRMAVHPCDKKWTQRGTRQSTPI